MQLIKRLCSRHSPSVVTLTATPAADPTRAATMNVTIIPPVSVSRHSGNRHRSSFSPRKLSPRRSPEAPNTNVTWDVNGVVGGNATLGTVTNISGANTTTYTAPAALPRSAERSCSRGERRKSRGLGTRDSHTHNSRRAHVDARQRHQRRQPSPTIHRDNFRKCKYECGLASRWDSRRKHDRRTNLRRRVKSVSVREHRARGQRGISCTAVNSIAESGDAHRLQPGISRANHQCSDHDSRSHHRERFTAERESCARNHAVIFRKCSRHHRSNRFVECNRSRVQRRRFSVRCDRRKRTLYRADFHSVAEWDQHSRHQFRRFLAHRIFERHHHQRDHYREPTARKRNGRRRRQFHVASSGRKFSADQPRPRLSDFCEWNCAHNFLHVERNLHHCAHFKRISPPREICPSRFGIRIRRYRTPSISSS